MSRIPYISNLTLKERERLAYISGHPIAVIFEQLDEYAEEQITIAMNDRDRAQEETSSMRKDLEVYQREAGERIRQLELELDIAKALPKPNFDQLTLALCAR